MSSTQIIRLAKKNNLCLPQIIFIVNEDKYYKDIIPKLKICNNVLIILRIYGDKKRYLIAQDLAKLCKKYKAKLLIAGDPKLALEVKADGIHISISSFNSLKKWSIKMPQWITTASAHNIQDILKIKQNKLNAALYSPVFPTKTHPNRRNIGVLRFTKDTHNINFPIYALGGLNKNNFQRLKHAQIAGIAGISIFKDLFQGFL